MAIEMTYFADKAPNKLAENRQCIVNSGYEQRGQVFSTDDFREITSH